MVPFGQTATLGPRGNKAETIVFQRVYFGSGLAQRAGTEQKESYWEYKFIVGRRRPLGNR